MARSDKKRSIGRRISSFFSSSLILRSIDRFTAYIYSLLSSGFFGYIFTGYEHASRSSFSDNRKESKLSHHLSELRYGICRHIEESFFVNLVSRLVLFLLDCKTKVYGAFLISFGAYRVIAAAVSAFMSGNGAAFTVDRSVLISLIVVFASLPLLFSRRSLKASLAHSYIGRFIGKITGYTLTDDNGFSRPRGLSGIGFICGVVTAVVTFRFDPLIILALPCCAIWAYLVLIRPEIGVLTLFFAMPFLPTMLLAAIVIYTFLTYVVKLIRGKRVLRFEPIDIVVMAFTVILFSGGIISLSPDSLKPALLMVCLILGYFLTVGLIESRQWLVRCSVASVLSCTLVSLYGIVTYYTGSGYFSKAWLDGDMFGGIANRAVSTLENPNMLGEYLILLLPIALSMLIGKGEGLRKLPALFCIGIIGICLILTWSRGAWLALIVALVCLLFMWHHRSIWLVIIGLASVPILPSILPASIISRFASIGNMSDSSTSYRVYIWRAAVNMLGDNAVAGIGVGESAWRRMYPLYSYMGIEVAPHSHNLFLQIWLELGVFGIVAFLAFVFLLLSSAFTLFRKLPSSKLRIPDLSEGSMILNKDMQKGTADAQIESKKQIRISIIGPLSGIIAVLAQGMTDYSWYNYRLYLMFWLVAGLTSAYIRNGNSYIYVRRTDSQTENNSAEGD